jgi:predicted nucleic acid-binding protein
MDRPIIAFDSCTVLHLLTENPQWVDHIRAVIDSARRGKNYILISEVTISEVWRIDHRNQRLVDVADSTAIIERFFNNSFIIRRGVTSLESRLAVSFIRDHSLGTTDALIAAGALIGGARVLYTTDGCGGKRSDGKLLSVPELIDANNRSMKVHVPDAEHFAAVMSP